MIGRDSAVKIVEDFFDVAKAPGCFITDMKKSISFSVIFMK